MKLTPKEIYNYLGEKLKEEFYHSYMNLEQKAQFIDNFEQHYITKFNCGWGLIFEKGLELNLLS